MLLQHSLKASHLRLREKPDDANHREAAVVELFDKALSLCRGRGVLRHVQRVEQIERDGVRPVVHDWIIPWFPATHVVSLALLLEDEAVLRIHFQEADEENCALESERTVSQSHQGVAPGRCTRASHPAAALGIRIRTRKSDPLTDLQLCSVWEGVPLLRWRGCRDRRERLTRKLEPVALHAEPNEGCHRNASMLDLCMPEEAHRCVVTLTPQIPRRQVQWIIVADNLC